MDDMMARPEYPAMLALLPPGQAAQTLGDRVKRINKINLEIADWLQERRRVEEQYVMGMRKLAQFKAPTNQQSELGVFQVPWSRITDAVERIAQSHHQFADRLAKDVEHPLRAFQQRQDVQTMNTMNSNLGLMAKELDEAQERSDKLSKKGGKASAQKVDAASLKLEAATQAWESQAPHIFVNLQAVDESRVNMLRELLTQYQTHESDQAQRSETIAGETLAAMLEISPETEVQGFVHKATAGKAQLPARSMTRRSTAHASQHSNSGPPSAPSTPNLGSQPPAEDDASEHNSLPNEFKPESKLRRLGTMFGGRRRQSVHAGFGPLSPPKASGSAFGRIGSSHGRVVSPRASSSNLHESNRLSILPELPDAGRRPESQDATASKEQSLNGNANGANESLLDTPTPDIPSPSAVNGTNDTELPGVAPPPGPPPSQQVQEASPMTTDAEGFTIRAPMHDPISEAQREAVGDEGDQPFKLNIQNKPIDEVDPEAAQAAFSSVANTLKMGPATRRSVTVRGRRDVRNTIYVSVPHITESQSDGAMPSIPASPPRGPSSFSRPAAVAALASEASVTGTSDSQSVRSGNSLGSLSHTKHPEMTAPGLNVSIIETVSAVFEGGVIKSAAVAGEMAFVNNPSSSYDSSKTHETIRINNFANLERIGPNRIFVHNASPDQPDQFSLDVSHLTKTSTAFSYRVSAAESEPPLLGQYAPLLINPAWKPQGDKLGLLLQYQLNPTSTLTAPVTLHNVVIVASYEGRASGAQTKPTGTHLKDTHLVYWRLGDVTLTDTVQKIVCRIIGAEGVEPMPGPIEARWEYVAPGDEAVGSGISISRLETSPSKDKDTAEAAEAAEGDPFADDDPASSRTSLVEQTWVDVPVTRRLVSGKYEGKSSI